MSPRKRTLAAEQEQAAEAQRTPDVFDEQIALRQAEQVAPTQPAEQPTRQPEQNGNGKSFADRVGKRAPDPFGVENIAGEGNRVRLLKSTADRAWVIRFDNNPNEMNGQSKENPHPVLSYLKSEGYRWGFADADGKGGWGKVWQEGHYTYAEHMDARKVLAKAAEMIGAKVEQGVAVG